MNWKELCKFAEEVYGTYVHDEDADEVIHCPECANRFLKVIMQVKIVVLRASLIFMMKCKGNFPLIFLCKITY